MRIARARIPSRTSQKLSAISDQRSAAPKLLALSFQLLARGGRRLPAHSDSSFILHPSSFKTGGINPPARLASSFILHPSSFKTGGINPPARLGFTLTELLVVLAIIALVATLAVPAIGPMFASNQTASAIGTISSMLVTAQATARAYGTPVALRIEQAYKTEEYTGTDRKFIVNAQGRTPYEAGYTSLSTLRGFPAVKLDHQQIRMLIFAPGKSGSVATVSQTFQVPPGGFEPVALPKDVWVAPGEAFSPLSLGLADLAQANLWYTPVEGIRYSVLDNFFVVFNASGELVRHEAGKCYYRDASQRWTQDHKLEDHPVVGHPWNSSLSLVAYDRNKWNAISTSDGIARLGLLTRTAVPIYINRYTGAVLEEKR